MGTYAVTISKTETATIQVEADDAPAAEAEGRLIMDDIWEPDTVDTQVDDVTEVVEAANE